MRTRVATRSAGIVGASVGAALESRGGKVTSGLGVGREAAVALGVGAGATTVSAVTGLVNDRRPAARKVTPSAVRRAGTIRVRIRFANSAIGRTS